MNGIGGHIQTYQDNILMRNNNNNNSDKMVDMHKLIEPCTVHVTVWHERNGSIDKGQQSLTLIIQIYRHKIVATYNGAMSKRPRDDENGAAPFELVQIKYTLRAAKKWD